MSIEMEEYREAVNYYAQKGDYYLLHNRGNDHALIILSTIFENAKKHIRIAANKLCNDEVVNTKKYIESMKKFLDQKDTRLDILIKEKPTKEEVNQFGRETTFYWMLFNHEAYRQGRVVIKEGKGKCFRGPDEQQIDFCTGDDSMYRLESDIVNRQATANFGDTKITGILIQSFDDAFSKIEAKIDLKEFFDPC